MIWLILPFLKCHIFSAGNVVSYVPKLRTKLIMSEKPNDGTVAMFYGEVDESEFHAAQDHLPTLPNTVKCF